MPDIAATVTRYVPVTARHLHSTLVIVVATYSSHSPFALGTYFLNCRLSLGHHSQISALTATTFQDIFGLFGIEGYFPFRGDPNVILGGKLQHLNVAR